MEIHLYDEERRWTAGGELDRPLDEALVRIARHAARKRIRGEVAPAFYAVSRGGSPKLRPIPEADRPAEDGEDVVVFVDHRVFDRNLVGGKRYPKL